jgi:DMSO reductase family type II enzyme chaperone
VHTSSANNESDDVRLSLDRARVYRALAQLFRPPDADFLEEARATSLPELCDALERLEEGGDHDSSLVAEAKALNALLADTELEQLRAGHQAAFDESSKIRCAPTEMDQLGGVPQLELTRTFEMADVAGFYRAFGVAVGESGQRPDHIAVELEFMNLLAVKEAIALQLEGDGEHAEICRDAARAFLRDHLGRWAPRLGEGLAAADGEPVYGHAGRLLGGFVAFDAERIDAAGAPLHDRTPRAQLSAGQRS